MPSIVIGKVKGDQGEKGFSPTVTLTKNENILSISVTDETGTKTESIDTNEAVQADWNTTDTALNSYIKNKPEIPSKVSQLQNDSGYLTDYTETDPTVPAWAKKSTKPEYTAVEVGARPNDTTHLSGHVPIKRKVNGKILNADITLSATDVGALPDTTTIPTALTDFGVTATASELNYVDGVTSNIQTQLNAKAASSHTHTKSEISDFPTSMTPVAHNQASNTINTMTGYSKPSSTSAIKTTDTLNVAIGKLEKALDSKGTSNLTIGTTSTTAAAGNHTHEAISEDFIRGLFA